MFHTILSQFFFYFISSPPFPLVHPCHSPPFPLPSLRPNSTNFLPVRTVPLNTALPPSIHYTIYRSKHSKWYASVRSYTCLTPYPLVKTAAVFSQFDPFPPRFWTMVDTGRRFVDQKTDPCQCFWTTFVRCPTCNLALVWNLFNTQTHYLTSWWCHLKSFVLLGNVSIAVWSFHLEAQWYSSIILQSAVIVLFLLLWYLSML